MKIVKSNSQFYISGVHVPDNFELIVRTQKSIQLRRPDGLLIWLEINESEDELTRLLNQIKVKASKVNVIMATGLIIGFRITLDYCRNYAPELAPEVSLSIEQQLQRLLK